MVEEEEEFNDFSENSFIYLLAVSHDSSARAGCARLSITNPNPIPTRGRFHHGARAPLMLPSFPLHACRFRQGATSIFLPC